MYLMYCFVRAASASFCNTEHHARSVEPETCNAGVDSMAEESLRSQALAKATAEGEAQCSLAEIPEDGDEGEKGAKRMGSAAAAAATAAAARIPLRWNMLQKRWNTLGLSNFLRMDRSADSI